MAVGALAALLVLGATPASAHPLGNFTVNTYSGLRVQPDRVVIDLVVDMAEIPTFQARPEVDADGDGAVGEAEASRYATASCGEAATRISVAVGGRAAAVRSLSAGVTFPPGAAGLPTMRLTCALAAATGTIGGDEQIVFRNAYYVERVGWREVTAVGDRATLVSSDVSPRSISDRLTAYPDDLLQSPPDQRSATVRARPGGPPAPDVADTALPPAAPRRGLDGATRAFTDLVARQHLGVAFGSVAVALSVALGALHALAPGHGKTIMAAYLVAERGTLGQAAVIALTVTLTHTLGVLVLAVVLTGSTQLAPESLYPWLGVVSGLLVTAIGMGLVRRALRARSHQVPRLGTSSPTPAKAGGGGHDALALAHGHAHAEHGPAAALVHEHGAHAHAHLAVDGGRVRWRTLVPMGLAGGMVPSPSALVVLLGAIAVGRAWFGVVLVLAYGLGMAATLTGAGLLLVRARGAIERRMARMRTARLAWLTHALPLATATAITAGGLFLAARAAYQL